MLAKMKVWTRGRHRPSSARVSTLVYFSVAFLRSVLIADDVLPGIMLTVYFRKVLTEVILTPTTHAVIGFVKRAVHVD